jgi:3-dehydroquinate dehydratase/shikimate dehydrogenase
MTQLCVSLTQNSPETMLAAMHGLPRSVGMAELRLDHLWQHEDHINLAALERLCKGKDRPIIATFRPAREGGKYQGQEDKRLAVLRHAANLGADFVDIELDSVAALGSLPGTTRRIVSYHNFEGTPPNIEEICLRARALGADVTKIAVRATDCADTLPILNLLRKHARQAPTIALSMGEEGMPTRVLSAKLGAFLTYACISKKAAAAEGQVPYNEMDEMYRFRRIGPQTPVYGVVANPVCHSMSPAIHNAAFAALGMDAVYLPFKVTDCARFLAGYEAYDLRGLSVTIPHKETMVRLMDEVDEVTRRIGALNTVAIRGGRRCGSNTDVAAAIESLESAAQRAGLVPLKARTVMLLGAGGAARAIAYGLAGRVGRLIIANRTVSRGEKLATELGATACGLDEIARFKADILVNTTSVGMHPNVNETPVPAAQLRKGMVVFDAVYNPIETRLLHEAKEAGCVTASGFDWFVAQAAAQFETWTGKPAPRDRMAQVVRERLTEHSL